MRFVLLSVMLLALTPVVVHAALPTSLEEFQGQIADRASDPKEAVKLWFDAIFVYTGGDRELGIELITEMMRYKDWQNRGTYFGIALNEKPHIFRSYANGATPANGYAMDPDDYELTFTREPDMKPYADKAEGEFCKLFVKSNGADNPRPMVLQRNNQGQYKVYEYSSIYSDVRPVEQEVLDEDRPESTDPVWAYRHWLQGILRYTGGDQEAGLAQMLSMMKDKEVNLKLEFHGSLEPDEEHIWRSYVKGTSPDNGYEVPDIEAIEVDTYFQPGEAPTETSRDLRMFCRSTGADSARPLRLQRDSRGQWRITEFSSLCVGVRPPKDPNEGNF